LNSSEDFPTPGLNEIGRGKTCLPQTVDEQLNLSLEFSGSRPAIPTLLHVFLDPAPLPRCEFAVEITEKRVIIAVS
jgi:hypothetical protein